MEQFILKKSSKNCNFCNVFLARLCTVWNGIRGGAFCQLAGSQMVQNSKHKSIQRAKSSAMKCLRNCVQTNHDKGLPSKEFKAKNYLGKHANFRIHFFLKCNHRLVLYLLNLLWHSKYLKIRRFLIKQSNFEIESMTSWPEDLHIGFQILCPKNVKDFMGCDKAFSIVEISSKHVSFPRIIVLKFICNFPFCEVRKKL